MNLEKQIVLLQGYYQYLRLGQFLNQVIKDNDLSPYATDLQVDTGEGSFFTFRKSSIEKSLADIYKHADKKNFFGYITELSAFKGVLGIIRELIDTNPDVVEFLKKQLGKQYFPFDQITRFCRNGLVHAVDVNITLVKENFFLQKNYLREQKKHNIVFAFTYADFVEEWKGSADYGLKIQVDFAKLEIGQKFLDIVSLHDLYLLTELCYNLGEMIRYKLKSKK